jgi:hypothetical protein
MPLFVIKAREPLGDRQCADHKGREEHKEQEGSFLKSKHRLYDKRTNKKGFWKVDFLRERGDGDFLKNLFYAILISRRFY